MQDDEVARPRMFSALHDWARRLQEVGEVPAAIAAAQSLCREAASHSEWVQAVRLLAELHVQAGDLDSAAGLRAQLVDAARQAVVAEPTTERKLALLAALDEWGEVLRRQGDHWGVLDCYGAQGRVAVLRELIEVHGLRADLLTDQCYSLRRAATAARAVGALDEARAMFEERLTVARLTLAGNPTERRLIELVATALGDLGQLLAKLGDRAAGVLLSEELCLRQWLQSSCPDDARARQNLAQCHLALTGTGTGGGRHREIATSMLSQLEAAGELDLTGRILLSGLRGH